MTILNLMKIAESSPKEQKTLWKKEKLLVTSNFFFSKSVFQRLELQTSFAWERVKTIQLGQKIFIFLAHLSTTSSRGAFRVVMCPSSVVNNFFKHLLLPNCWANLGQTWQECSLGGPLQKVFTEFDSIKNSGCHGNEIEFF